MTMPAVDLLKTLFERGANVRVVDGQLWVKALKGTLGPELRQQISERKPEIISLLTTYPCRRCGWGRFSTPTTCFHCRQAIAADEAYAHTMEGARS